MHHANFANKGNEGGGYGRIYGVASFAQDACACFGRLFIPGRDNTIHRFLLLEL